MELNSKSSATTKALKIPSVNKNWTLDKEGGWNVSRIMILSWNTTKGKVNMVADALSRESLCVSTMMIRKWQLLEEFRDLNLSFKKPLKYTLD